MVRPDQVEIQLQGIDLKARYLTFSVTPDWFRRVCGQQAA